MTLYRGCASGALSWRMSWPCRDLTICNSCEIWCRLAQGATQKEWKEAHGSALLLGQRGAELEEAMGSCACALVMEYVPGRPLLGEQEPFQAQNVLRTAEDLGRWPFVLFWMRLECHDAFRS